MHARKKNPHVTPHAFGQVTLAGGALGPEASSCSDGNPSPDQIY